MTNDGLWKHHPYLPTNTYLAAALYKISPGLQNDIRLCLKKIPNLTGKKWQIPTQKSKNTKKMCYLLNDWSTLKVSVSGAQRGRDSVDVMSGRFYGEEGTRVYLAVRAGLDREWVMGRKFQEDEWWALTFLMKATWTYQVARDITAMLSCLYCSPV